MSAADSEPDRSQFRRLVELCLEAAELPPDARRAFLEREAGDRPDLVERAARLLPDDPVATARLLSAVAVRDSEIIPDAIGPYRILGELGAGGMGVVYLVEQQEPIRRRVALKVIKLGMDTRELLARFERERQILAAMQHDGIAKIFDCGITERGQPFFAMEWIKGRPLTTFCTDHRLPLRERIALVQQLCGAVQHAHQKGVVHRDLTPRNVLVAGSADAPRIKVIDFGLAKAIGPSIGAQSLITDLRMVAGTVPYMAPEQTDPGNADIDTRADVYAIGVMLYELLVDSLPYEGHHDAGIAGLRRAHSEVEPDRPSTRLRRAGVAASEIARSRGVSPMALHRALRQDLDWIVLRAMDREPERRYQSPSELAADLQRYLDGDPVVAGPPSASYRMRKLARRYRTQLALAVIVFVLAIAFGGYAWIAKTQLDETLARYDQVESIPRCDELLVRERKLQPAWPQHLDDFDKWLQDAADLLSRRSELVTARDDAERDPKRVFLSDSLRRLIDDLELLAARREHVLHARRWAAVVEELTFRRRGSHPSWDEVRRSIADDPGYRDQPIDLRDEHVLGLVPIGRNERSGLWEFYHLRSAWDGVGDPHDIRVPVHRDGGRIDIDEHTGIVFVLIPGGMSTTHHPANGRVHIRKPTEPNPWPTRDVRMAPFLLSRFELTQGQWQRLWVGEPGLASPSEYTPDFRLPAAPPTLANPVEQVDWQMSTELLSAHGLLLPTVEQWEYACRAGTAGDWYCARAELRDHANVGDDIVTRNGWHWGYEDWNDGHIIHAPVGSFAANPFGLHDMHGNVWEWCENPVVREGERGVERRVLSGGSYFDSADRAKIDFHLYVAPTFRLFHVGVRAARPLRRS